MGKINFKKKTIVSILSTFLLISLILQGCTKKPNDDITYIPDLPSEKQITKNIKIDDSSRFDTFLDNMFKEYITSSPLEMSMLISSPQEFGLQDTSDKLDDFSDEALKAQYDNLRDNLKTLNTFNIAGLTNDQQLSYKIIKYYLELNIEGEEYVDYSYNIKHTLGFHIGIPLTLSQIPIKNKADADNFIARLKQFPTSIAELMKGEQAKAQKGYIQPEYISNKVIDQCKAFMTPPEENFLYLAFCDYVNQSTEISDSDKESLKAECLKTINDYVYPAYTNLIEELEKIKSQTIITSGVYTFPKGREYYAHLIKSNTGTNITPEDLFEWANDSFIESSKGIQSILEKYPDLTEIDDLQPKPFNNFEELYQKCKELTNKNFYDYHIPKINSKTIPNYLEKDLPSAFYLPVSIDLKKYGNMFLQTSAYNNLNINDFLVVCHEGIPGHHFQFSIAYQQENIPNIRKAIDFTCFSEGWASYIEGLAFGFIDYGNPQINQLMIYNLDASYALLTLVDLYIHYYGASREEVINTYSLYFGEQMESIVDRAIANPGETLHYAYGRYFINNLKEKAMEALGDDFDIKEFHDVILINGEIPLYLLEENVSEYINKKSKS
ncbi:DUF885 domain-containing protein [Vallitalea guaymasensis]|uniref:DUF885 domain-containing protein n=1 Tax=Vallitalea guaymasensis TaxID=1185412 RepID=UPI00272AEF0C|nr:DUF885 domain-containing protein [Vallitalea guaymasensis]